MAFPFLFSCLLFLWLRPMPSGQASESAVIVQDQEIEPGLRDLGLEFCTIQPNEVEEMTIHTSLQY
jgi:hypothetical protein